MLLVRIRRPLETTVCCRHTHSWLHSLSTAYTVSGTEGVRQLLASRDIRRRMLWWNAMYCNAKPQTSSQGPDCLRLRFGFRVQFGFNYAAEES